MDTTEDVISFSNIEKGVIEANKASEIAEGAKYGSYTFTGLSGFSDTISDLTAKYGLSISKFKELEMKSASDLSASDLASINSVRNEIPKPTTDTVLQKVVPKPDLNKYLTGTYKSIGGCVTRTQDSRHLQTFEDIFYGLRLDYTGTSFNLSDNSCLVIRFKPKTLDSLVVPRSPANGGTCTDAFPFTGHGFTSASNSRLGAPEWSFNGTRVALNDSAEMYEISTVGSETLVAKFDEDEGKFILAK